jgi:hypothetical protein
VPFGMPGGTVAREVEHDRGQRGSRKGLVVPNIEQSRTVIVLPRASNGTVVSPRPGAPPPAHAPR